MRKLQEVTEQFDVVVCGGGMAGVCAAIAAARKGLTTALVQDRPVLGGNASSEIRVHIGGVTDQGYHYDSRESGIIEEIRLESAMRDPLNEYLWLDTVLYTFCLQEPTLTVYLNTPIFFVAAEGKQILSVTGVQAGSERVIRFKAKMFIDSTGDGTIGYLAGAGYRMGREARAEFNETLAPEISDNYTLGASIMFRAEDMCRPVSFTPPPWAEKYADEAFKQRRGTTKPKEVERYWHDGSVGWWWIEYGGMLDSIHENEDIRHQLQAIVYGVWDYIKNKDERSIDAARNYEITWIGQVPGKRESRRIIGDYILHESDLLSCRIFPDQVAVGGWSIDLHPPMGFYHPGPPSQHTRMEVPYSIPFRCLYAKDIDNLLLASRCISVSHVAHGSTRLIATLACIGQAAGTAAKFCIDHNYRPRDLVKQHLKDLQQDLLRDDQYLLGIKNEDPKDLARKATIRATSEYPCEFGNPDKFFHLDFPVAQRFYLPPHDKLAHAPSFNIYLKNETAQEVSFTGGIRQDPDRFEFQASVDLTTLTGTVGPKFEGWVEAMPKDPVDITVGGNFWIYLNPAEGLSWGQNQTHWPGFRMGYFHEEESKWRVVRHTGAQLYDLVVGVRGHFCFKVTPALSPFPARAITNGEPRPFLAPNLWISAPVTGKKNAPAIEVCVDFENEESITEIWLTLDTDLDRSFPHRNPGWERTRDWPIGGKAPPCIKDLDAFIENPKTHKRTKIAELRENYQRRVKLKLPEPAKARRIVLVPLGNWGCPTFRLYELRVY